MNLENNDFMRGIKVYEIYLRIESGYVKIL